MNKLSFSAINTYTTCGKKYELRYKKGYRSKWFHAPLAFGSAIDAALNKLLLTKDKQQALEEFDKAWNFQWVNKKYIALAKYTDLVYAETDFDEELLQQEDIDKLIEFNKEYLDYNFINDIANTVDWELTYQRILEEKKSSGWMNVSDNRKAFYNYANWLSMRRKGHIMIESYNKKILPQIQEVLVVQKENYLKNSDGDEVVQYLDLIVKWKDGRNILMDNKTSAREYLEDSAGRSLQLISYYFSAKEEYKLDAVGFIVLMKTIHKNRIKICSKCGFDGSGRRHKTCPQETDQRCGGTWNKKIRPECDIRVIINEVHSQAENLVLSSFNNANEGIKKENYYTNLSACKQGSVQCEYYNYCWYNNENELVNVQTR